MRTRVAIASAAALLAGCTAIIGVKDLHFDESAAADGGPGGPGGPDGSNGDGATDGGPDGSQTCNANFQTDVKNCGRCAHDCLGGPCNAGQCGAALLAASLAFPSGIAVDANAVYVTTFNDNRVIQLSKDTGGTPKTLMPGQIKARGVFVDGTTLYWANEDYTFDGVSSKQGGAFKCTLPACTTRQLVAPGDWALNVQVQGGVAYFASDNASTIVRALPDAGAAVLVTTNHPFGLAVDATHAYYTSGQPTLYRALLADGGAEAIGPLNANNYGFVALDATRFYWAFTDTSDVGHVFSGLKADPAARIEYGTTNKGPVGVAVDATYLYWSTDGTSTGGSPNGDGVLYACPKVGCPATGPLVLADKLAFSGPIALDNDAVYFVEGGDMSPAGATGRVRKVAKP